MNGLNKVLLVGALGADPEIRFPQNGKAVCNFSIATTENHKDQNGKIKKVTEWHQIVSWGKVAEYCGEYLFKGSKVYIEGSLRTNSWTDTGGSKRSKTIILVREVQIIDRPKMIEEPGNNKDNQDAITASDDQQLAF